MSIRCRRYCRLAVATLPALLAILQLAAAPAGAWITDPACDGDPYWADFYAPAPELHEFTAATPDSQLAGETSSLVTSWIAFVRESQ